MATTQNETIYEWDDLSDNLQAIVCKAVRLAFNTHDLDKIKRVYDLGKPKIVFAADLRYFRVHEDSKKLMVMLTKTYLL